MTNNHKEYSHGITLESLKCWRQIYRGCTYLCRKGNEATWGN